MMAWDISPLFKKSFHCRLADRGIFINPYLDNLVK